MTWAAIGARLGHRGVGVGRGPIRVVEVLRERRIRRHAWAFCRVVEAAGDREAFASLRAHFVSSEGAARLDVEELEHVAGSVDWCRERAEYLHECGVSQWTSSLGPDQTTLDFDGGEL